MTPEQADAAQQWAGMPGSTAWLLIERHADGWDDIGAMMDAWLRANVAHQLAQRKPAAWLRVSNISGEVTGVFLSQDVPLRTERLEPLYK